MESAGFDVHDLKAFCDRLKAKGIALTTPYQLDESLGLYTATITDPWGTVIELTEGLRPKPQR